MNIEYRAAKVEDAAGIATVEVLAQQIAYRHFLPASHLDNMSVSDRTQVLYGFIQSDDPTQVIVAAYDERVIGWMRIGKYSNPQRVILLIEQIASCDYCRYQTGRRKIFSS